MDFTAFDDEAMMDADDVVQSTEVFPGLTQSTGQHSQEDQAEAHASESHASQPHTSQSPITALFQARPNGATPTTHLSDYEIPARRDAPEAPKFASLPYSSSQTGLVYDVRMRFHVDEDPEADDMHPEDPRRIHVIFDAFVRLGLAWKDDVSDGSTDYYMARIDARQVTKDEVCLVHTPCHWDWVQSLSSMTLDQFKAERQHPECELESIFLSTHTPACAALSAGGAIEACRAILLGKVKNAFAVVRPPGHHAEREDAKGFCFFDNVSIAAKVCQREFGDKCRKVLVLDWDVHHGNGIQQANYEDPNVLYISLHRHDNGNFYPENSYRDRRAPYGDHVHCGSGAGLGANVNIPWSKGGMGDADYVYAFQQIVMPIATQFNPDLVIIAAGFDAAVGDMLGGCNVTPAGFAHMTHMLMSLADGKLAVCLEGGYNLDSIARSACTVARTMMGEPPDRLMSLVPTVSGVDDVKLVLRQQSRFWSCLYPKDLSARLAGPLQGHGERLDSVVRRSQAEALLEKHMMTPLYIYKDSLTSGFGKQVLATQNLGEARPLFVAIHDPPEVFASPDPRTGKVELHNSWLVRTIALLDANLSLTLRKTDTVKSYIDSAVEEGFAVIDVNLPKLERAAGVPNTPEHHETDSAADRAQEAARILTYLWDNYIEVGDSTHVFLMGTDVGHGAIVDFIKSHQDRAQRSIARAISFVDEAPLRPCKSSTNDQLARWYYKSSLVYLAHQHSFWQTEFAQKPRRHFGRLQQCLEAESTMAEMLVAHQDEVFENLREVTAKWKATRRVNDAEDDMNHVTPVASPGATPIGKFALSPRLRDFAVNSNGLQPVVASSSRGALPPVQNFASSPRLSPGR